MKKVVRSEVRASADYPRYRQQADKMKEILENFAMRHYDGNVIRDVAFRHMANFPTVYASLEVDGHLCYAIFNMYTPGVVEVEAGPPRVTSVRGVDQARELIPLYTKFASVIEALWSALDAAAKAGELEEEY